MRDFGRRKSVNKVYIWNINCHLETKFKIFSFAVFEVEFCPGVFGFYQSQ